jgi:hypothetical protein
VAGVFIPIIQPVPKWVSVTTPILSLGSPLGGGIFTKGAALAAPAANIISPRKERLPSFTD